MEFEATFRTGILLVSSFIFFLGAIQLQLLGRQFSSHKAHERFRLNSKVPLRFFGWAFTAYSLLCLAGTFEAGSISGRSGISEGLFVSLSTLNNALFLYACSKLATASKTAGWLAQHGRILKLSVGVLLVSLPLLWIPETPVVVLGVYTHVVPDAAFSLLVVLVLARSVGRGLHEQKVPDLFVSLFIVFQVLLAVLQVYRVLGHSSPAAVLGNTSSAFFLLVSVLTLGFLLLNNYRVVLEREASATQEAVGLALELLEGIASNHPPDQGFLLEEVSQAKKRLRGVGSRILEGGSLGPAPWSSGSQGTMMYSHLLATQGAFSRESEILKRLSGHISRDSGAVAVNLDPSVGDADPLSRRFVQASSVSEAEAAAESAFGHKNYAVRSIANPSVLR